MNTESAHSPAYARYIASKAIDYERWHDGEGYDLDAFAAMTPAERDSEAAAIIANGEPDWRDLEVLGAHGTRACIEHLRGLLLHPSIETRAHALGVLIDHDHTPGSVADVQLAHIIDAIEDGDDDAVTPTLLLAQEHAGPISKLALLRGAKDKPSLALHFASALLDLAGISDDLAAFDPALRPLLLRLLPDNAADDRMAALDEVCRLMNIDHTSMPEAGSGADRTWAERIWPRK